jgi:hypothetical protein
LPAYRVWGKVKLTADEFGNQLEITEIINNIAPNQDIPTGKCMKVITAKSVIENQLTLIFISNKNR